MPDLTVPKFQHSVNKDVAQFNLSAVQTAQKLRIDWAKAQLELAEKRLDIAKKQIAVATDLEHLQQLRVARREFNQALHASKSRLRSLTRAARRHVEAANNAERLLWCEMLDPDLVSAAWRGLKYLFVNLPAAHTVKVSRLKLDRVVGADLSRNRFPQRDVPDPPKFKTVLQLCEHCRVNSLMPRSGSRAHAKIGQLLELIAAGFAEIETQAKTDLFQAREELSALRATTWKKVGITA